VMRAVEDAEATIRQQVYPPCLPPWMNGPLSCDVFSRVTDAPPLLSNVSSWRRTAGWRTSWCSRRRSFTGL
jgi:hypothetical protein